MQKPPPRQSRRRAGRRPTRTRKKRKNNRNITLIILGLTLFCAVIAAAGLFYYVITTSPDGTFDLEQLLRANPTAPAAATALPAEASATPQAEAEAMAAVASPVTGFTLPPEFTKTPTSEPTLTFTPTDTPEPSNTPSPTETIALWTQAPIATFDPNATATFTPLASETAEITATPGCSITTSSSLFFDDQTASYELTNNADSIVTIVAILIDWDTDNVRLNDVSFGGRLLWNTGDLTAPTEITENWLSSESARQLESGETKVIAFRFHNEPAQTYYSINVTFDNGCISGHSI